MEADGETPWEACRREVREECGLEVSRGRLACMDFRRPRPGRPGGVRFLFDCGALDPAVLDAVVLQPEEIAAHRLRAGRGPLPAPGPDPAAGPGGARAAGWSTWRTGPSGRRAGEPQRDRASGMRVRPGTVTDVFDRALPRS